MNKEGEGEHQQMSLCHLCECFGRDPKHSIGSKLTTVGSFKKEEKIKFATDEFEIEGKSQSKLDAQSLLCKTCRNHLDHAYNKKIW